MSVKRLMLSLEVLIAICIAAVVGHWQLSLFEIPPLRPKVGLCEGESWCNTLADHEAWVALWRDWIERASLVAAIPIAVTVSALVFYRKRS